VARARVLSTLLSTIENSREYALEHAFTVALTISVCVPVFRLSSLLSLPTAVAETLPFFGKWQRPIDEK